MRWHGREANGGHPASCVTAGIGTARVGGAFSVVSLPQW